MIIITIACEQADEQQTMLNHLVDLLHCCRIRGNGEVIKREEFDQRKAAAEAARLARLQRKPQKLASQGKNLSGFPLLQVPGG
jgi:hypothetical protein